MGCYKHQCCTRYKELTKMKDSGCEMSFNEWKKWYNSKCESCSKATEKCLKANTDIMVQVIR